MKEIKIKSYIDSIGKCPFNCTHFFRSYLKSSNCKMSNMHVRKISWQNLVQTNSSHLNSFIHKSTHRKEGKGKRLHKIVCPYIDIDEK